MTKVGKQAEAGKPNLSFETHHGEWQEIISIVMLFCVDVLEGGWFMGVVRWLCSVDPRKWEEATTYLEATPPTSYKKAVKFLESFGRKPGIEFMEELKDDYCSGDEADRAMTLNHLLEMAVSEHVWEMGRGLDEINVFKYLPDAGTLKAIFEFDGMDISTPDSCFLGDGLYGCCSLTSYGSCVEIVNRYQSVDLVQAALAEGSRGLWNMLSGRKRKLESIKTIIEDPRVWAHWEMLREAVIECSKKGHHLGLAMES